jgi:hypothetical protein
VNNVRAYVDTVSLLANYFFIIILSGVRLRPPAPHHGDCGAIAGMSIAGEAEVFGANLQRQ